MDLNLRSLDEDNSRFFNNYNLADEQLKTLQDISRGLHLSKSFEEMGRIVFHNLQQFKYIAESGGKLAVYYEEKDLFKIEYLRQHKDSPFPIEMENRLSNIKYFSKIAIEQKKTILIKDSHSEHALRIDPTLIKMEPKSMIFIPLYYNDKLVGLFSYARIPENSIDGNFAEFLECIGKQLCISISGFLAKQKCERLESEMGKRIEKFEDQLQKEKTNVYNIEGIVTKDLKLQNILDKLPGIARSEISILIEGETGTGKELFARDIHNLSDRKNKPYIIINCGAIPPNLLESELFGHKKGSFTGANENKPGKFLSADGGTLFLDEIGELPIELQPKILRFLETKEIEPVGSLNKIKLDVRILSATNKNLLEMIKKNKFREDLYHRLNKFIIHIPPLRERREDIIPLTDLFINNFRIKKKKNILGASIGAKELLYYYSYPGNVRELESAIEHAFAVCNGDSIYDIHLPKVISDEFFLKNKDIIPEFKKNKTEEKKTIIGLLKMLKGNKTKVAKKLCMSRTTFYRKLDEYNID